MNDNQDPATHGGPSPLGLRLLAIPFLSLGVIALMAAVIAVVLW